MVRSERERNRIEKNRIEYTHRVVDAGNGHSLTRVTVKVTKGHLTCSV